MHIDCIMKKISENQSKGTSDVKQSNNPIVTNKKTNGRRTDQPQKTFSEKRDVIVARTPIERIEAIAMWALIILFIIYVAGPITEGYLSPNPDTFDQFINRFGLD